MAKRKRGQASAKGQPRAEDDFNPANSKLRIKTYEDVADSEDEFHAGRDEVLLDAARGSKRRKAEDDIMEMSDEEVLAGDSDDDDENMDEETYEDDEEVEAGSEEEEEEEDLGGYGASAADYYGADVLENEQDALEEEEEARRIQQKNLRALKAADFGFDENDWLGTGEEGGADDGEDEDRAFTEVLPQVQLTEDMGPAERLKLLKQRYPLFEPLSKEFLALQDRHQELEDSAATSSPIQRIQYHALSGYLGALAMYFALLTSTATVSNEAVLPLAPQELQNHPIFSSIEKCQMTWNKVKDLTELSEDEEDSDKEQEPEQLPTPPPDTTISLSTTKPKKAKKSRTRSTTDDATLASAARRAARLARTEASLATLSTLTWPSKPTTIKPSTPLMTTTPNDNDADSDIGDEAPLSTHDAAEKERKRKSLRFYTSQIVQKANKRANAGRSAGGDDDVPYRERFRDRQERLNREAEARGKKGRVVGADAELGGDDSDDGGEMTNRQREEDVGDDAEETALLNRVSAKKAEKLARDSAYKAAVAEGGRVVRVEDGTAMDGEGKRGVTYQIEKNKGLMPRRKKDVKNPRVKKRKKYEEKTKKLASMKPVYKGGEGRGGYQGQLTGIKSNLVRSVKL